MSIRGYIRRMSAQYPVQTRRKAALLFLVAIFVGSAVTLVAGWKSYPVSSRPRRRGSPWESN